MIEQSQRRQQFITACDLLGGQRAVARILDVSDRTVRNLCSGNGQIKLGFMRDLTTALEAHARACQRLARSTDPLFSANWTAEETAQRQAAVARGENARG